MDYLKKLGSLALGSRLKRLSDYLYDEVQKVYESNNLKIPSRCFPVVHLLHIHGAMSVTEIAEKLGLTHPAISQVVTELKKRRLVRVTVDPQDKRRSVVALSESATKIARQLESVWEHIQAGIDEVLGEDALRLMDSINQFERSVALCPLSERVQRRIEKDTSNQIKVIPWDMRFAEDFGVLNRAWLQEFDCSIEPGDTLDFNNPYERFIKPGGMIFFALLGETAIGTCALLARPQGVFEVAKMAVTKQLRGKKIGALLLESAEQWAVEHGAQKLVLETISKLAVARRLYEKSGFTEVSSAELHYGRADIKMEKSLSLDKAS